MNLRLISGRKSKFKEQSKLRVSRTWNNFVKKSADICEKFWENFVTNLAPPDSIYSGFRMAVWTTLRMGETLQKLFSLDLKSTEEILVRSTLQKPLDIKTIN
jgi:hypothetical protein